MSNAGCPCMHGTKNGRKKTPCAEFHCTERLSIGLTIQFLWSTSSLRPLLAVPQKLRNIDGLLVRAGAEGASAALSGSLVGAVALAAVVGGVVVS